MVTENRQHLSIIAVSESVRLHAVSFRAQDGAHFVLARVVLADDGRPVEIPIPHRVSGSPSVVENAERGLLRGAAQAEAVAARLAQRGVDATWGEPDVLPDERALTAVVRERAVSSVDLVRAQPSLLPFLQIGAWYDSPWSMRLARRLPSVAKVFRRDGLIARLDRVFWAAVRGACSDREWERYACSSYVALLYHRLAGEGIPGEERLDVPPAHFGRRLALLNSIGFKAISPEELLRFHDGRAARLPRRRYVVTVDDGFEDAVAVLARHPQHRAQLFVPTALLGQGVPWGRGRVADGESLQDGRRAGVAVGSHTRTHAVLPELSAREIAEELEGSLSDLRRLLPDPLPIVAYPHGRHDDRVRAAARAAGYEAAYTTAPGRNGAGTDPHRLRRISVKAWDSTPAFLWKVLTGEHLPARWDERLRRKHDRRSDQIARPTSSSS